MTWPHRVNLIVPAALLTTANAVARAFDPDSGGDDTFVVPLSATGTAPTTHYGASTAAAESFVEMLTSVTSGQANLHDVVADDYVARWPDLTPPTAEECVTFLAQACITVDVPWEETLRDLKPIYLGASI